MLLIPERKALFLHIPKTGGQTIEALLGYSHQHAHHSTKGLPNDWRDWFRFSFVRHPMDRFVSACNYYRGMAVRYESRYRSSHDLSRMMELRLWLLDKGPSLDDIVNRFLHNPADRKVSGFSSQVKRLKSVDPQFIGRFERFSEDVSLLLRLLGRNDGTSLEIPRVNRSSKVYCLSDLSGRGTQRLARLYRRDMRLLGYKASGLFR